MKFTNSKKTPSPTGSQTIPPPNTQHTDTDKAETEDEDDDDENGYAAVVPLFEQSIDQEVSVTSVNDELVTVTDAPLESASPGDSDAATVAMWNDSHVLDPNSPTPSCSTLDENSLMSMMVKGVEGDDDDEGDFVTSGMGLANVDHDDLHSVLESDNEDITVSGQNQSVLSPSRSSAGHISCASIRDVDDDDDDDDDDDADDEDDDQVDGDGAGNDAQNLVTGLNDEDDEDVQPDRAESTQCTSDEQQQRTSEARVKDPPKNSNTPKNLLVDQPSQVHESKEEVLTEQQIEEIWAGRSNVMVAVRCRPISKREVGKTPKVVYVVDKHVVAVVDGQSSGSRKGKEDVLRQNRSREKRYAFDHAFGPETKTREVYEHTTKFLIDGVIIGYNATVFAYGATGAGKTFTMLGGAATATSASTTAAAENMGNKKAGNIEHGIMVLTLHDLFAKVHSAQMNGSTARKFKITCSFLEVYNEMIRDLLTPTSEYLDLREDPVKGPTVAGLSEVEATCADDVMRLLRKGNARRSTEGTGANEASSRSHAVLQITVEQVDDGRDPGTVANVTIGKLSLIDLAGSERASATQNSGMRQKEGANINRSLLALGNCINALREGGRGTFVPYRDSKLTRLLKDSLGGNCRTVMIAAVSPAGNQTEETLNTLKYANRAKNIKTKVERNVLNVDYHVTEYVNLIARLKSEITSLRNKLKKPGDNPGESIAAAAAVLAASVSTSGIGDSHQHIHHFASSTATTGRASRHSQQQQQTSHALGGGQAARSVSKQQTARKSVEKQQMAFLREQLVLNFKERMQLRRSLIEIEAQNIANNTELEMHQLAIRQWESDLSSAASATEEGQAVQHPATPDIIGGANELAGETNESIATQPSQESNLDASINQQHNQSLNEKSEMVVDVSEDDQQQQQKLQQQTGPATPLPPPQRGSGSGRRKRRPSNANEPEWVRVAHEESAQLQRANLKNSSLKSDIEARLRENQEQAEALRKQMDTRITTEERRELMELEYRIGMLELENMELERSRMLHKSSMAHKDTLIQRLLWQLQLRDNLIDEQKKLLALSGVEEAKVYEFAMEIEPLRMLESLPKGPHITPLTPHKRTGSTPHMPSTPQLMAGMLGLGVDSNLARTAMRGVVAAGSSTSGFLGSTQTKPDRKGHEKHVFPMHRLEEELQRIEKFGSSASITQRSAAMHSANSDDHNNNHGIPTNTNTSTNHSLRSSRVPASRGAVRRAAGGQINHRTGKTTDRDGRTNSKRHQPGNSYFTGGGSSNSQSSSIHTVLRNKETISLRKSHPYLRNRPGAHASSAYGNSAHHHNNNSNNSNSSSKRRGHGARSRTRERKLRLQHQNLKASLSNSNTHSYANAINTSNSGMHHGGRMGGGQASVSVSPVGAAPPSTSLDYAAAPRSSTDDHGIGHSNGIRLSPAGSPKMHSNKKNARGGGGGRAAPGNAVIMTSPKSARKHRLNASRSRGSEQFLQQMKTYLNSPRAPDGSILVNSNSGGSAGRVPVSPQNKAPVSGVIGSTTTGTLPSGYRGARRHRVKQPTTNSSGNLGMNGGNGRVHSNEGSNGPVAMMDSNSGSGTNAKLENVSLPPIAHSLSSRELDVTREVSTDVTNDSNTAGTSNHNSSNSNINIDDRPSSADGAPYTSVKGNRQRDMLPATAAKNNNNNLRTAASRSPSPNHQPLERSGSSGGRSAPVSPVHIDAAIESTPVVAVSHATKERRTALNRLNQRFSTGLGENQVGKANVVTSGHKGTRGSNQNNRSDGVPGDGLSGNAPNSKSAKRNNSQTVSNKNNNVNDSNSDVHYNVSDVVDATTPEDVAATKQAKEERKERRKLEKKWAELEFVLRKTIQSDNDIATVRQSAEQSLTFLDQLDCKAAELNVLRGTLSRMLLPYHENTAAETQRASTPVEGDSPLDSVMDLSTRKQLVRHANELRSLVRVKIADDADLDQARTAVCDTKVFFDKLALYATKREMGTYQVLQSL